MTKKNISQNLQRNFFLYTVFPAATLAALTVLVYAPSVNYAFQFDDVPNILKNFNLRQYTFFDLFFSGSRWFISWINSVQYALGKFDPYWYRLFNIAVHTLNGLLIFFILQNVLKNLRRQSFFSLHSFEIAFTTALLFLLHPVQTQTVSYVIQGQLEGLAFFFILLITLFFIKAAQHPNKIVKNFYYLAIFTLIPFSCSTKEIAIISPLLLFIIDWFFIAQGNLQAIAKRCWFYCLYTISVFGIYFYYLKPAFFLNIIGLKMVAHNNIGNVLTAHAQDAITPGIFFISQFKVILHYLWIFLWPFNLSVEYDWKLSTHFFALDCIIPLLMLLALFVALILMLKKSHISPVAFGLVWFFACIIPRSSIIPSSELLVDYKTYMASLGLLFLVASLLVTLFYWIGNRLSAVRYAASGIFVMGLALCTAQRNTIWHSPLAFWGDIIKHAPQKARAYNNYGVELSQIMHKYKESLPYFLKAIELDNRYPDAYNNVAVVYSLLGDHDAGIRVLKKCMALNPRYPEAYNNLASFLMKKKEYEKAEQLLYVALKLRPHYGKAYYNLCRIYAEKGDHEKAWHYLKDGCTKADFDTDFGFFSLGSMSFALRKYEDAIWAFNKTVSLNPRYPNVEFNLGNCYFYLQRLDEALMHYKKAAEQNPNDPRPMYNLAETYFVMGDTKQALNTFNRLTCHQKQFPNLTIRIAACYEKMGNPLMAYNLLKKFSELAWTQQYRPQLSELMKAMEKQYKFA